MKAFIIRIVMGKVREILDKTNELDDYPEVKDIIAAEVESWLRDRLGVD